MLCTQKIYFERKNQLKITYRQVKFLLDQSEDSISSFVDHMTSQALAHILDEEKVACRVKGLVTFLLSGILLLLIHLVYIDEGALFCMGASLLLILSSLELDMKWYIFRGGITLYAYIKLVLCLEFQVQLFCIGVVSYGKELCRKMS